MTKQLSTTTNTQELDLNQIQQIGNYGLAEVMAMKDTLGKELSIPQFNLFVHDSVRLGLEPRLKHSFPILYGGKMDFRISFEGYHSMAQRSDGYIGLKMEVVTENEIDEFYAETDDDGDIVKVYHKIKFPRGKVVGSYAIAKREGKKNLIIFCDKAEFEKYAKKNGQFWKLEDGSLDPDMCKKHAGTRAIKGQFAVAAVAEESTESMYNVAPVQEPYERKDITAESTETPQPEPPQESKQTTDAITEQWSLVGAALEKLGVTDKKKQAAYIRDNLKIKGDMATVAELKGLIKIIEMEIEDKNDGLGELE